MAVETFVAGGGAVPSGGGLSFIAAEFPALSTAPIDLPLGITLRLAQLDVMPGLLAPPDKACWLKVLAQWSSDGLPASDYTASLNTSSGTQHSTVAFIDGGASSWRITRLPGEDFRFTLDRVGGSTLRITPTLNTFGANAMLFGVLAWA